MSSKSDKKASSKFEEPRRILFPKAASVDHGPGSSKPPLERGDVVHASDSDDDILPDPKVFFRRNSDVRKCVSPRRSVRRIGGSVSDDRERFREQRRFSWASPPTNSIDLSKSLSLTNECSLKRQIEHSRSNKVGNSLNSKVLSDSLKTGNLDKTKSCGEEVLNKSCLEPSQDEACRKEGVKDAIKSKVLSNNSKVKTDESICSNLSNENLDMTSKSSDVTKDETDCSKKLSRVELLMNNDLFKKHLSKHAELLQRHTINSRRHGLRKAVSNIDISSVQLANAQPVLTNLTNKVQNTDKVNNSESKPSEDEQDENSPISQRLNRQIRRTSLSCMDVSQIGDFLSSSCPNFTNPTRRKKVHIPSFEEFRKNRNLTSGNWRETTGMSSPEPPQTHNKQSSKPKDSPMPECMRCLDPISEDMPCETMEMGSVHTKDAIHDLAMALKNLATRAGRVSSTDSLNISTNISLDTITDSQRDCVDDISSATREISSVTMDTENGPSATSEADGCAITGGNPSQSEAQSVDDVQFDEVFVEDVCQDTIQKNILERHTTEHVPNENGENVVSYGSQSANVIQSKEPRPSLATSHSVDGGACRAKPGRHRDIVFRSTSDVSISDLHKKRRERKERPYKSDPFSCSDSHKVIGQDDLVPFQSTPKKDMLQLLGNSSVLSDTPSYQSLDELPEDEESESYSDASSESSAKLRNRLSNVSTTSTDSGVIGGVDVSTDFTALEYSNSSLNNLYPSPGASLPDATPLQQSKPTHDGNIPCPDCNPRAMPPHLAPNENTPPPCTRCLNLRGERKETIQEIVDTEVSYGRDLKILRDEFFTPMKTTGLLSTEQLDMVFLNLQELIQGHELFLHKLQSEVTSANNNIEDNLTGVCIGTLFLESSSMFQAFENYCINQAHASQSLEQFEKDKELLHVFLQASQRDNSLLRRMHLKSFLMVPVQRIMKYPLLLGRLYKLTASCHKDKENIKLAQNKLEEHLEHINAKAKFTGSGSFRIKRKRSRTHGYSLAEKSEVNKVALEVLGWSVKEVGDLITTRMMCATPTDHTWAAKRCKNLKFGAVHAVLLTLGQPRHERRDREHNLVFPKPTHVQQAAVVLVREKNGRYQAMRDPLHLDKCVVTVDPEFDEVFELHEWGREALVFKADDPGDTRLWTQHLKQLTRDLGQWRRRRNALPNIMIKNTV